MNNKKRKAVIKKTVSNMTSRSKKTSSEKEESWLGTDPITNETQVCVWYCAGGTIYSEPQECPPLTKTIAQTLETIEPEPDTNEKK